MLQYSYIDMGIKTMKNENEQLIDAAKNGKIEDIEKIVSSGVSFKPEIVSEALMAASESGNIGVAKVLIKNGADLNKVMRDAIYTEKNNAIMSLINAGADTRMAVAYAINTKNYEALKKLQESGNLNSAEQMAIAANAANDGSAATELKSHIGADDNNFASANNTYTPLMKAAEIGNTALLSAIIASGADINAQNKRGETAAFNAALRGQEEALKLLYKHGADLSITDNRGRTVEMETIEKCSIDLFKQIITDKTAEELNQTDNAGHNDLMHAVITRDQEKVALLVEKGVDLNTKTKNGLTAMMYAVRMKDNIGVVETLIKGGADINLQDKDGQTALMLAAKHNRLDIIEKFIEAGCDVTIKDKYGKTYMDYFHETKKEFCEKEESFSTEENKAYIEKVRGKLNKKQKERDQRIGENTSVSNIDSPEIEAAKNKSNKNIFDKNFNITGMSL